MIETQTCDCCASCELGSADTKASYESTTVLSQHFEQIAGHPRKGYLCTACWEEVGQGEDVEYVKIADPYAQGAVWVSSWGYEQTNVDFYVVTRSTKKSVWFCRIQKKVAIKTDEKGDEDWMRGGSGLPRPGDIAGEEFRKIRNSEPCVGMSRYEFAYPWDGSPQSETYYA